jgi:hypothetical protein
MIKAIILAISTSFFLQIAGAYGQDPAPAPAPELPPGPLIEKRAPDFSKWIIKTVSQSAQQSGGASSPEDKQKAAETTIKTVVTKTLPVIHVQTVDDQNRVWSVWVKDSMQAVEFPDRKSVAFVKASEANGFKNPLEVNFSQSDFDGFDWLSKSNFVGVKDVMGRKCLVFTTTKMLPVVNYVVTVTASVDFDSRLPVSLVTNNNAAIYQFLQPPAEMQTLPPAVEAMVAHQQAAEQSLARGPGRPF